MRVNKLSQSPIDSSEERFIENIVVEMESVIDELTSQSDRQRIYDLFLKMNSLSNLGIKGVQASRQPQRSAR